MNTKNFKYVSFALHVGIAALTTYQTMRAGNVAGELLWTGVILAALVAAKAFTSTPNAPGSAEVVTTDGERAQVERASDAPADVPDEGEPPDHAGMIDPAGADTATAADITPSPIRPEQGVFYDRETGTLTVPANGPSTGSTP